MTRKSMDVLVATPPDWVHGILEDFDGFLADHANCERKACALALSLTVKHPERTEIVPTLIAVAREELEHFEQCYALMRRRGLSLAKEQADPYVNALATHMRSDRRNRLLDQLLVSSVVESRGAERFRIVASALQDPELRAFYDTLWKTELKHGHQFVDMALKCYEPDEVYPRLQLLLEAEAELVATLPWRASLH